ncbi:MAG: exosortase C-terminal domain/associated protein EpsI [Desulfuromonadales bacterium]
MILLLLCLSLTATPVLRQTRAGEVTKPVSLTEALMFVPGWQVLQRIPLDPGVIEELKPDDYAYLAYTNGSAAVSLYIGYYFSATKVGAPHHPLVCFTGQGWELSPVTRQQLTLAEGQTLSFASLTAGLDLQNMYIGYWFQAHDEAISSPFGQKLSLARKRFFDQGEENAFVRVSMPIGTQSPAECRRLVEDFLQAFYPVFLTYIRERA